MAYFRCEWISEALDMATSAVVILPETGDLARTPVVYLLHGLSDNCTGWSRYTAVERYARNYGVAVVMPEVQRSFYCDTRSGMRYFTYISQELPFSSARPHLHYRFKHGRIRRPEVRSDEPSVVRRVRQLLRRPAASGIQGAVSGGSRRHLGRRSKCRAGKRSVHPCG